jgi:hypothetical protein
MAWSCSTKPSAIAGLVYVHLVFLLHPEIILAQTPTPTAGSAQPASPQTWSPSKDIGVFVFAKANQSPQQQLKDESECYGAAKQQSGIDPKAPAPPTKTAEQKAAEQKAAADNASGAKGGRVCGAAAGAAVGAIAGDAGTGAAAGAAAGTMRGGRQQRKAAASAKDQAAAQTAAQQQKEEEQAKLAHAQGLDGFQRAFEACMDARNYFVT